MLPQVPPQEFGVPVGVVVGVVVGVAVPVGVAVSVGVAVGVPVAIVNDNKQALVGVVETSSAFGLLLGAFGATVCCLS